MSSMLSAPRCVAAKVRLVGLRSQQQREAVVPFVLGQGRRQVGQPAASNVHVDSEPRLACIDSESSSTTIRSNWAADQARRW